jgi:hypothetical protein
VSATTLANRWQVYSNHIIQNFFPMKIIITAFLVVLLTQFSISQNKVVLHRVLGEEISLEEKKMYLLFEGIENDHFESGNIIEREGRYYLNYICNKQKYSVEILKAKLEEYHLNIEKLLAYEIYLKEPDKFKGKPLIVAESKDSSSFEIDINYLSEKQRKQLNRTINSFHVLNEQAKLKGYKIDNRGQYVKSSSRVILQPVEWFIEGRN